MYGTLSLWTIKNRSGSVSGTSYPNLWCVYIETNTREVVRLPHGNLHKWYLRWRLITDFYLFELLPYLPSLINEKSDPPVITCHQYLYIGRRDHKGKVNKEEKVNRHGRTILRCTKTVPWDTVVWNLEKVDRRTTSTNHPSVKISGISRRRYLYSKSIKSHPQPSTMVIITISKTECFCTEGYKSK